MKLEYDYELDFYQIELIHKDGSSEFSFPARMTPEIANDLGKNTVEEEENLVDYKIKKISDEEAEKFILKGKVNNG